jgi:hypothetical protein
VSGRVSPNFSDDTSLLISSHHRGATVSVVLSGWSRRISLLGFLADLGECLAELELRISQALSEVNCAHVEVSRSHQTSVRVELAEVLYFTILANAISLHLLIIAYIIWFLVAEILD